MSASAVKFLLVLIVLVFGSFFWKNYSSLEKTTETIKVTTNRMSEI